MAKTVQSKRGVQAPARPAAGKAAAPGTGARAAKATSGDTRYAQKLLNLPDLGVERSRLLALKQEARSERATQPGKAKKLLEQVDRRLTQLEREVAARAGQSAAKFSDGSSSADYAASLRGASASELTRGLAAARAGKAPDDKLRATALRREQARRAGASSSAEVASEKSRLEALKDAYGASLDKGDLGAERSTQERRVASALAKLQSAQQGNDPKAIAAAERALRSEYARRAVLNSRLPVAADPRAVEAFSARLKSATPEALTAQRQALAAELEGLSSGALRGTRSAQATSRAKLDALDHELKRRASRAPGEPKAPTGPNPKPADPRVPTTGPVNAVDRTRNPGNVVFNGPGMMVDNASAMPPEAWAQKLKASGVSYVMLQIHNGRTERSDNLAALDAGWADKMRAAGIKVGFWGVSYTEPEVDAKLAATLTARYRGDFYVADCEGDYQDRQGDPGRNRRFVDAFQAEANAQGIGNVPRALSSMGRVALDMKPWIDNGWDAMPQAYWNSYEHYSPSASVKFYEEWGWPRGRIHPTIATYDGGSEGKARPKSIAEYANDLKASGTTGFNYYLPESYLDDTKYAELQRELANGMNGPG